MKIKKLGRTGLYVSEVCLGTMTFGNQATQDVGFEIMDIADNSGIFFFDTADMYPLGGGPERVGQTEVIVGNWLKERNARDRIVLATKCYGAMSDRPNDKGLSRRHIIEACEASLKRLQTDYIDLYQAHFPDSNTPIEETMSAFDSLVKSGKVRYVGCSNYPAWQLAESLWTCDKKGYARYDCHQPRYNILFRVIEEELVPLCQSQEVGIIAYNPLAGGMLTGRYVGTTEAQPSTRFTLDHAGELYRKRYWKDAIFEEVSNLKQYFTERDKSLTHVALSWTLSRPGVTSAILGASKPEQLLDSLKGVDLVLEEEELAIIDAVWYNLPRENDPQVARR